MSNLVLYNVKSRVGYITLNRPDKRNALSYDFVSEIKTVFRLAEADPACKVIVVKAKGETFCSGADLESLQQLQNNSHEDNLADSNHLAELFRMIYTSPKVVISQVEGAALAGGCGLATVCDFCFASTGAKFAYPEVKIGFVPAIVMVFLIRKVGELNAKRLLLTGDLLDAKRAKELHLINDVMDDEMIGDEVFNFAQKLCDQTSSQSMALTKEMINGVQNLSLDAGLIYASEMNARARKNEDCKKGISAFLNKEKISW